MTTPSTHTTIAHFHRLQNASGWVVLAQLDNSYIADRNTLSGHLVRYSWDLVNRMVKPITLDRFYEILQEQSAIYLETGRIDSKYILRKVMLTKRKTYPYPLWKIEIGSESECLAAIFPPQGQIYRRKERGEE